MKIKFEKSTPTLWGYFIIGTESLSDKKHALFFHSVLKKEISFTLLTFFLSSV
jgi:hypothetical protein